MLSMAEAPGRAALCQDGFWLRSDVACTGVALRKLDGADAVGADGASRTYGNSVLSSLSATWSYSPSLALVVFNRYREDTSRTVRSAGLNRDSSYSSSLLFGFFWPSFFLLSRSPGP